MKAILKLRTNDGLSEISLENGRSVILGRNQKSDFKIIDSLVSGAHCKVVLNNNKLEIHDLCSKNGTYLNGIRVERSDIFIGDIVKVGKSEISVYHEKMNPIEIQALSFKGSLKDRLRHELRPDFTRVGFSYQRFDQKASELNTIMSMEREINLRRKGKSNIFLSKDQIKRQNMLRSSLASTIDLLLCLAIIVFPLLMTNILYLFDIDILSSHRAPKIFLIELVILISYIHLNFNLLKFSLGEKITGIEKIYLKQT